MNQTDLERAANRKAKVAEKFEAWSAGTGSPFELLAEDATWTIAGHSVAAKTYDSREAFMNEVIRPFNARMSVGLKPTIRHLYMADDTAIILFDAKGTARDGQPYENTYAWFMRFAGDDVVEVTAFFDSIEFNDFWSRVSPAT